jgi:hypothetical protein
MHIHPHAVGQGGRVADRGSAATIPGKTMKPTQDTTSAANKAADERTNAANKAADDAMNAANKAKDEATGRANRAADQLARAARGDAGAQV